MSSELSGFVVGSCPSGRVGSGRVGSGRVKFKVRFGACQVVYVPLITPSTVPFSTRRPVARSNEVKIFRLNNVVVVHMTLGPQIYVQIHLLKVD